MPKINDKIKQFQAENPNRPFFSFEYFPPKTELGVVNLYERFDRMAALNPMWIDVTWGAGGSTAEKTMEICTNALKFHGLDVMMHLTCTNMPVDKLHQALTQCKEVGICNILALRGDPPAGIDGKWEQVEGGFAYATDLVKYIRQEFGDFFCVGVAGYPEAHLESKNKEDDLKHLKEKIDAGSDLIVTQLFYDTNEFISFVKSCREMGITVPILPGIMPIQSYEGFRKMTTLCKTKVPQDMSDGIEPFKEDDKKVKDYGVKVGIEMCQELLKAGVPGLHFYTLNLEGAVMRIIDGLKLRPEHVAQRKMPWRPSVEESRKDENVRPIFWANRPASYIKRTKVWDDFPNGRFGSRASPAYGDITDVFVSYSKDSFAKVKQERLNMWGTPTEVAHIGDVFVNFLSGTVKKLPWCHDAPSPETNFVAKQMKKLNNCGLLTINSQPRCNGVLSNDPYLGWGPSDGFVYQKAYCEFFCSPEQLEKLLVGFDRERLKFFTYTAVNQKGEVRTNVKDNSVTAVTWGVFPGEEIVQPTVVDYQSFMAWKDEAFSLWNDWIELYDDGSASKTLLQRVKDTFFLVNIVDNDFVRGDLCTQLTELLQ